MATEITDANFEQLILKSNKPAVVDFWATWCRPCTSLAPIFEQLYSTYSNRAVIGKIDVDRNRMFMEKYGIKTIPTILFFKNGKEVDRHSGMATIAILEQKLNSIL